MALDTRSAELVVRTVPLTWLSKFKADGETQFVSGICKGQRKAKKEACSECEVFERLEPSLKLRVGATY